MLRTLVVLLLLHALLLQVTAEPAASTAAAAKPKKEKRKKAPKEEVDIFADDYEDEEEEELFPPPSWDEQQMMYEGFVKQDSDGDGEINREDFIEFLAMSLVEELYSHKGIKSEINSGTPLPFVMPECWPPCPREEETLERCARAFANVGSVTNACREGRC